MSECYVVVVNDRHMDVYTLVYAKRDEAIEQARGIASEYSSPHNDTFEENHEKWEFYIGYGVEGDCVFVEKNIIK